jgi:hypothetical protein
MIKKIYVAIFYLVLLFFYTMSFANTQYFMCGNDEDGCQMGHPDSCVTVAIDENYHWPLQCSKLTLQNCLNLYFQAQSEPTQHSCEPLIEAMKKGLTSHGISINPDF